MADFIYVTTSVLDIISALQIASLDAVSSLLFSFSHL